jgi:hypothetical protein
MDIARTEEGSGRNTSSGIEGILNYIVKTSERPVYYAYQPPDGVPQHTGSSSRKR